MGAGQKHAPPQKNIKAQPIEKKDKYKVCSTKYIISGAIILKILIIDGVVKSPIYCVVAHFCSLGIPYV